MHHKSSREQRNQHREIVERHTNIRHIDYDSLRRFHQKPYQYTTEEKK